MYNPARHVDLCDDPWEAAAAAEAIQEIVDDAISCFDPSRFWPAHPKDQGFRPGSTVIYGGAAGVIWSIDYLRRHQAASCDVDFASSLGPLMQAHQVETADWGYRQYPSLLMGDLGLLLLEMRLSPRAECAERIYQRTGDILDLPVLELMWGMPGTMLASLFMHDMTGEQRWQQLYGLQAERLLAELGESEVGPIWTQHLYGRTGRYLGPVHGFAGNMWALLRGWKWLNGSQKEAVASAINRTLPATARETEAGVNWPATTWDGDPAELVQHCHGAPGMVTTFADAPARLMVLDQLLKRAGEFIWRAGPLAKGSNLCHGTGGNGYAFLRLYAATGDTLWLDRARIFAMTAVRQCRRERREYGQGRYSLWTGDPGLAVYLWDCITGQPRFPTVDVF